MSDTMTMSRVHGKFVWYELMTPDMNGAEKFYGEVTPWTPKDASMPYMKYSLLSIGESHIAGIMPMLDEVKKRGIPPNWTGYVAVDDVDASTAFAKKEGGKLLREPTDIPNTGRFSVIADPQGAAIALFTPLRRDEPKMPPPEAPGMFGWRELHTTDREAAFGFYAKLLNWTKLDAMDMGPMGLYQIYGQEKIMYGGMFNDPMAAKQPFWAYYINVASVDAAAATVQKLGGKILNGPMQVPGGSWVINCVDPQGAFVSFVGPK